MIHWTDTIGYRGQADFDEKIAQLRADWDLLTSTPEGKAALVRVLQAQHDRDDAAQAEEDAGVDI